MTKFVSLVILTAFFMLTLFSIQSLTAIEIALEAELGEMQAPAQVSKDKDASRGEYIGVPEGGGSHNGWVDYEFEYPMNATYWIAGKVIAPDGGSDSFYVTFDGEDKGDVNGANVWDTQQGPTWHWDMVMGRNLADPRPFELKKGKHTLRIWMREDGTKLDCLFISTDRNAAPREPTDKDVKLQKAGKGARYVEPKSKLTSTWGMIKNAY